MRHAVLLAALIGQAAYAQGDTPFGKPANPSKAQRSVRIEMTDEMRYSPAEITVKRGETVRFQVVNKGKVEHELVLGTMAGLKKHAQQMKVQAAAPAHKDHAAHEMPQPYEVEVAPGRTGVLGWQFTKTGVFYYGCLIPGHFEAGMVGKVTVK